MLGEQIGELKGKMIGQRVLDAEEPTIETSVSARGSVKGIQVNETLTYVARLTSSGVLHGEGHGVIMAGESDLAAYLAREWADSLLLERYGMERFSIGHRQPVTCHFLTMLLDSLKPKWTRREIFQRVSGNGSSRFLFSFSDTMHQIS